jgi:membrane-associated phospholipid phosphatase
MRAEGSHPGRDAAPPPLLPPRIQLRLRRIVVVSALGIVVIGAFVAGKHGPLWVEAPIDQHLIALKARLLGVCDAIVRMSQPTHFAAIVVALLVACAAIRSLRTAILLIAAIVVELVGVEVIKEIVRRHEGLLPAFTYPSGHAGTAAVIGTVVILACQPNGPAGKSLPDRLRLALITLGVVVVVVVSLSVVILQEHYLTDALAGIALGTVITLVIAAAIDRWGGLLRRG